MTASSLGSPTTWISTTPTRPPTTQSERTGSSARDSAPTTASAPWIPCAHSSTCSSPGASHPRSPDACGDDQGRSSRERRCAPPDKPSRTPSHHTQGTGAPRMRFQTVLNIGQRKLFLRDPSRRSVRRQRCKAKTVELCCLRFW